MRQLKIIYTISVTICAIELLLLLISPFGGPLSIIYMMKNGIFSLQRGYSIISINSIYNPIDKHLLYLEIMNSTFTSGYFLSLIGSSISLLLYRLNKKTKYKIGICFFIASLLFSFGGGAIWRYLAQVWIIG